MADIEVKLKLTADGTVLVSTAGRAEGAMDQLGEATLRAGQQASQGFDIAAKGSANLKAEMTEARNTAVELAAAFGGLTAIKGLAGSFIDAADAQGQLDARIRRVIEGTAEQAAVTARLQQIAHDAYEDINRLTEIFVRSVEVTRQLGISTAQTLDITEALALSMVVSATAADKRQQSIDALSKSMQNGYIAAEQLEGILAGAPRFVTALEQSLGKTRAELLGMARDGELTIDMLTRVSSELEKLRAEVEDMPTTVEDAILRWGNAFQSWASSTNEVYGATSLVVSSIDMLSANIDTVMLAAIMAATAGLGILLTQGARWATGLYEQAQAAGVQARATLEARQAGLLLQQQQQAAAINFQRAAQADMARAEAALSAARADQAAARAAGLRATSEVALARASIAMTQADIASAGATSAVGAARAALVRANAAVVQSNAAVAASTRDVELAVAGANGKLLSLTNVIGAITAAGLGWEIGTWARSFETVRVAADYAVSIIMTLIETAKTALVLAAEAFRSAWVGALNIVRAAAADIAGMVAATYERMAKVPALKLVGYDAAAAKLREIEASIRPTTSAWEQFARVAESSLVSFGKYAARALEIARTSEAGRQATQDHTAALQEFERTGVVSTVAVDAALSKLGGSLRQQDAQLKEQVATFGKGRAGALEYAQALELLKGVTIADEAARARYEEGVRSLFAPLIENARALDALSESTKRGTQETEAARKAAESYIEKLREEVATLGLGSRALLEHDIATLKLSESQAAEARSLHAQIAARKAWLAQEEKAKSASQSLAEKIAALRERSLQQRDALAGLSQAQIAYNAAMREAEAMRQNAVGPLPEFDIDKVNELGEALKDALDVDKQLEDFADLGQLLEDAFSVRSIEKLQGNVARLGEMLGKLSQDDARYAGTRLAYARANVELWEAQAEKTLNVIGAVGGVTQAIGGLFAESEKGQKRAAQLAAVLAVAEQAAMVPVLIAKASEAIMTQAAKGDPYSAFARMAMMAAAIAPLLSAVGAAIPAFGGGSGVSTTSAAYRQEHQGTGTVLGDASAKSESIARAVEITADATRELVGINRGMLTALQAMQAGISGASGLLARGAGDVAFGGISGGGDYRPPTGVTFALGGLIGVALDKLFGGLMNRVLSNILGGKESLRDTGIRIVGGALSDMIDDIMVQAYQTIHRSGGWFRSSRDYDRTAAAGDDVSRQFQMVLASMADAVSAAADALGLNMDEVNAAIASFRIEEIRISTMDLSAEEAQAEIEAVFSKIFDGLAGHVVPFIAQFQRVGEGLAETLIRVATSVQVAQEAVIQLGFALDETDPERIAQISVGLMDLMGGVDGFISGMGAFVDAFAPESHKFAVAQDALTRAFAQFGLEVPTSRDAMWELMQTLDATTESGREQIAMLLRLAGVADSYYQALERDGEAAARAAAEARAAYDDFIGQFRPDETLPTGADASTVAEAQAQADAWAQAMIDQANQLAIAAGLAGAAEEDLALIHQRAAEYVAQAAERIDAAHARGAAAYADLIAGILRETQNLSAYQSSMRDADAWRTDAIAKANEHARAAGMAGASEQALALIELRAAQLRGIALAQLREETQSLVDQLYGPGLSDALTAGIGAAGDAAGDYWAAQRRAAETLQNYLDSMLLGDLSALTPEQQLAEAWEQLNAAVTAGDADQATRLADVYLRMLRGMEASGDDYNQGFWSVRELLEGMLADIGEPPESEPGGGGGGYITAAGAEQIAAQNRLDLAVQLAQHLADLAGAVGQTVWELMDSMGVDLRQLTADLGISLQDITAETVLALVNMAGLLGTNLLDLTSELGLQLTDLGGGIRELAENTGINLDALTVQSTQALGALANQLGIDLADIAASVGVDLGSLADAQSLLNQALAGEINRLPAEQGDALRPYLAAIENATSEADANAAIEALSGHVNTLAPDIRNALAPYFADVFPVDALTDLDYLTQIATDGAAQLAAAQAANALLARIADNAMAANNAAGIPSYAVGTYNVPQTGPAILHAGEMVLPVPLARVLRDGMPAQGQAAADNREVVAELRRLGEKVDQLERSGRGNTQELVTAIDSTGERSDRELDLALGRHNIGPRGRTP